MARDERSKYRNTPFQPIRTTLSLISASPELSVTPGNNESDGNPPTNRNQPGPANALRQVARPGTLPPRRSEAPRGRFAKENNA
jgi:hypothetical protein